MLTDRYLEIKNCWKEKMKVHLSTRSESIVKGKIKGLYLVMEKLREDMSYLVKMG